MNGVKNIGRDLVDKRLWPVAVALVAALVAVPVLLAKSPDAPKAPTTAAHASGPVPAGQVVALATGAGRGLLQAGGLKDPFRQQHLPAPPKTVTTVTASTASTSSSSSSSSSGGSRGSNSGGGSTKTATPKDTTVRAVVRFGPAGAQLSERTIESGTPLPSTGAPLVIYLGLLPDGKRAQFMVSSDANAQGDGTCSPSANVCATVTMKAGQTEFLDVTNGSSSRQYQLDYLGTKVG